MIVYYRTLEYVYVVYNVANPAPEIEANLCTCSVVGRM